MPYISANEFKMVKHILAPEFPQGKDADELESAIYAINQQIKDLPGDGPTEEWRNLLAQRDRFVIAYRRAGGRKGH